MMEKEFVFLSASLVYQRKKQAMGRHREVIELHKKNALTNGLITYYIGIQKNE